MVRLLFGTVFLAAFGWGAYWFIGANAQESAVEEWLDARQSEGWVADTTEVNVKGFPNRFDTSVTDLKLADPASGWAWDAPDFHIKTLSYQPNHVIVQLPQIQTLSSPQQNIQINSEEMRSSIVFKPSSDLELDRLTTEMRKVVLESSAGWASKIDNAVIAARQSETVENAYDLALDAKGFAPTDAFREKVDKAGALPKEFETLVIEATTQFDRKWDQPAVETELPALTGIKLERSKAVWGALELQASGGVTVDAAGYPTGKVTVRARNWKNMIAMAVEADALTAEMGRALEQGLSLLTLFSGDKDYLEAPLNFNNKLMSLGPIPVGAAPRLVWAQ